MPLIMNAPTLADRVLEILPDDPENAMSANELAKFLPGVKNLRDLVCLQAASQVASGSIS